MPLCPNQHESRATDFCEVCGVEMTPAAGSVVAAHGGTGELCPACHTERETGGGDFCEVCGYHLKTGAMPGVPPPAVPPAVDKNGPAPALEAAPPPVAPAPVPTGWKLVISIAAVPHAGMPDGASPPAFVERTMVLDADALLIGRRSARRNLTPEISLDHDDGVSHRHAQLTLTPEGSYRLEDLGSSNGTRVNGAEVAPGTGVVLKSGDVVEVGRWSKLAMRMTNDE